MFPDAVRRWLYRHSRASWLARLLNAAQARLAAAGIGPGWLVMVEVTGRRSGKTISFPAVIAGYDHGRYLVSMLGEDTNWVRNVRASGGHAVRRSGLWSGQSPRTTLPACAAATAGGRPILVSLTPCHGRQAGRCGHGALSTFHRDLGPASCGNGSAR